MQFSISQHLRVFSAFVRGASSSPSMSGQGYVSRGRQTTNILGSKGDSGGTPQKSSSGSGGQTDTVQGSSTNGGGDPQNPSGDNRGTAGDPKGGSGGPTHTVKGSRGNSK
ncbi:hypothetical protein EDD18DRAFT_1356118 [Armillaria luteobubalina]|uniref:Uncharacterized protein n=1 Tax=Armillaria luteobubalina TaxID=153913 RepID=A0AA39ULF0_9AGAR|nr:hypothetical protein EDD18DRAFT_1356118 [Armillaria luteobubalina]